MIRIKILEKDISTVAKVVLINNKKEVLFLKRSDYVDKYAGDWDLPGGHLKKDESIVKGLKREVKEETQINILKPVYLTRIDNLNFFYSMYNSEKIILSDEHTEFKFFSKKDLNRKEKFQNIAFLALERVEYESINN